MLMQQQSMHMSQRMAMPNHITGQSNSNFNPRPPQQDDFMNILDSASQSGNSDYIELAIALPSSAWALFDSFPCHWQR
jgi:hypothetical protein